MASRRTKGAAALHGNYSRNCHGTRSDPRFRKATELAAEAYKTNQGILEIIREQKLLLEQQINELLDPVRLTGLARANT